MMNKTLFFVVLLAALSVAVCAQSPPAPSNMGTVLTGSDARTMLGLNPKPGKNDKTALWTPTARDVVQMEKDLSALTTIGRAKDAKFDAAGYNRQYVGMTNKERRLIVINAFTPETYALFVKVMKSVKQSNIPDWRTRAFVVADGGHAIFHATYDVQAHQFTDFSFNGYI